ncbi:MAG: DUF3592 domain-containing protein [Candidatus Competibacter sp.]|nr:DUF3592 domain-containing protein [Candidatus Competibacter sp.]MDG4583833.1 DUF3592 domain-containing protein [Candidatus Competibacter sp.]
MSEIPLHPGLQKLAAAHRRRLRLLGLLFFMGMAGALIFMMTIALSDRDMVNLLIFAAAGLVMLPSMALAGGLLWHLERRQTRRLNAANQILRENAPTSVRLAPTGLASRLGTLVAVQPETHAKPSSAEPVFALLDPAYRWGRAPRRDLAVQLYCSKLEPNHELVALRDNGGALLGKLVALESYRRQTLWMTAVALSLIALGMAVLAVLAMGHHQEGQRLEQAQQAAAASESWPHARGTVLDASVVTLRIPRGKTSVTGYRARVEFEYSVAGSAHRGDLLSFCQPSSLERSVAEARLARYPGGAPVEVRYDPANPGRGVLEPGHAGECEPLLETAWRDLLLLIGLIGLLALVGLAAVWEFRKQWRVFRTWAEPH